MLVTFQVCKNRVLAPRFGDSRDDWLLSGSVVLPQNTDAMAVGDVWYRLTP